MHLRHTAFLASTATAILVALTPQAFAAVDGDAVFAAFARQMSMQGFEVTSDSVQTKGDDVQFNNLKFTVPGGDNGFQMESVVLENVEEGPNGSFVVGRAAIPAFSNSKEGMDVSFEGAEVLGYYIAGPQEIDPILGVGIYRELNVGAIEVSQAGSTVFALDGITSTMSPYEAGGTLEMDVKAKDFFMDFSKVQDPKVQQAMTELGYLQMRGRLDATGTWDTSKGDLSVKEKIELDDAATLNVNFDLGGYSAELVAAIKKLQIDMKDQSEQAKGMALLGLMQQIEIAGIEIELIDQSATGRFLDFAAKQQGGTRDSVIAQAKATLPFALAQLQNPEFAAKVTAAVSAYLDDPRSLKIIAAPATPVPVAQLVAAAMGAPQSLINVLSVDVMANE